MVNEVIKDVVLEYYTHAVRNHDCVGIIPTSFPLDARPYFFIASRRAA